MSDSKKLRKPRAKKVEYAIPVIRITNPFNPREFVRESVVWKSTKTIAEYFPLQATEFVISVNGRIVPTEQYALTYLGREDNLVVCPIPTGGGDSKSILSMIAMIAVAVVAPEIAAYMTGEWGVLAGASTTLVTAGITVAGSLLVHAILAPSQKTGKSDAKTSSYGIDGAKNTSVEGIPVPISYGTFRLAGNILGLHVDSDADDNQTLYMLISAGEGPVSSISGIFINDNPIADFHDLEVQTRLGNANQLAIPWFNENIVAINKGQKLTTDWFYSSTTTVVDKLRLDFVAPGGLFSIDKKSGATNTVSVDLQIEYRPTGDGTGAWTPMPTVSEIVSHSSVTATYAGPAGSTYDPATGRAYTTDGITGAITYIVNPLLTWTDGNGAVITDATQLAYLSDNPAIPSTQPDATVVLTNSVPVYGNTLRMSASKRSAVRRSFPTPRLTAQRYDVRVMRTVPHSTDANVVDEIVLSDINEITLDTLSYPNTALLGLKIKLTDQLSGLPKVTYLSGGRMIQVYGRPGAYAAADQWFSSPSSNPAWIVWDILTNVRYGGAMPIARLDFIAFKNWAAYCDTQALTWNGVMDSEMNVWDATQIVLRVGHAQLVNVGTRYTIVVEKAADPVMMFSVANMIEGTYKETWLPTTDRANDIDVSFFDRLDNYKQRTVKVYDPGALAAGAKSRTSAITLYGVVDYETAYKEAQFQLNLNRYIRKTVSFSAPMEAVACTVGDLILVQHDMTQWAQAGRFEAASTTTSFNLDRTVTMTAGLQYKLLAMHDAVQRYSGTVTNVVGSNLFLLGFDGAQTVKRIQVNGRDLRVAGTFNQGAGYGVILDDTTSLANAMTYTLWDTDVIEEVNIVNVPGDTTTLTAQSVMSFAPGQFVNWMFGDATKVKMPFRVKAVVGGHEYRRDITAIEYRPEVYDFSRYGSNVPTIPLKDGAIGPARSLTVYEETYVAGANIVSRVVANWTPPITGLYAGADVYVQINDGKLLKVGEAVNRTSYVIGAAKGDTVTVKVVAYDMFDKRSLYDKAPTATYKVIGEISSIDVGGVSGAGFTWSGRDCKITWRYNSTTHSYEFGSEPTGGDAGSLDPQFKDYEVRVYDQTGKILRRTEYTTDNSYTYIYDKNFSDGLARHLVFEIRMRDKFNNLGAPATLDAYNPPPTITTVNQKATFESASIAYTHSNDPDFVGVRVYLSRVSADLDDITQADSSIVYQGPNSACLLPGLMFNSDYYFRLAAYDAFGFTELVPTLTLHFKTSVLNVESIADGVLAESKLIPALQARIDLIEPIQAKTDLAIKSITKEITDRNAAVFQEVVDRGTAIVNLTSAYLSANATTAANGQSYVQQYAYSKATADGTLAATVSNLTANFTTYTDAAKTQAIATSAADIRTYAYSIAGADSAISVASTNLTAAYKTYTNTAVAGVTTDSYTKAQSDASIAAQTNTITTAYTAYADAAKTTAISTSAADIRNYSYSKASVDGSLSSQSTTLTASFNAGLATAKTNSDAYLNTYAYSKADADSAVASQTATLRTTVGTNSTAIQTNSNSINGLTGQYTVKIDTNGYVSGFGLAQYPTLAGPTTSEFIIRADSFAVVMPSYGGIHPFTIGAVNSVPRVIISSALIGDASINTAMIGDAQINSLQLAGSAVTVPVSVNSIKAYSGTNVGVIVNEGYMTLDQPGIVYAICTGAQGFPKGNRTWGMELYINDALMMSVGGAVSTDTPVVSGSAACPGPLVHVVVRWFGQDSSVALAKTTLFMIGSKR